MEKDNKTRIPQPIPQAKPENNWIADCGGEESVQEFFRRTQLEQEIREQIIQNKEKPKEEHEKHVA